MNQKMIAGFSKKGDMRFISHLDLMRLFQRASRRASLPVAVTKGFSPHLKISISRALRLGVESPCEEVVFHMAKQIRPEDFIKSINEKLPAGITITSAKIEIPPHLNPHHPYRGDEKINRGTPSPI